MRETGGSAVVFRAISPRGLGAMFVMWCWWVSVGFGGLMYIANRCTLRHDFGGGGGTLGALVGKEVDGMRTTYVCTYVSTAFSFEL